LSNITKRNAWGGIHWPRQAFCLACNWEKLHRGRNQINIL